METMIMGYVAASLANKHEYISSSSSSSSSSSIYITDIVEGHSRLLRIVMVKV